MAWVAASDQAVNAAVADPGLRAEVQTYKGWGFVLVSAALVFVLVRRMVHGQAVTTTKLSEKERAHAMLLSNLPGMAYRCRNDAAWTMEFVSDGCRALTGYEPDALRGSRQVAYSSLIVPDDRERVWHEVQQALAAGAIYRLTYRIQTAQGQRRWVWEQGRAIGAGDGMRLEGVVLDVSERKRLEEMVLHSQKMEAVGRLASGIAHDYNNTLTVVLGCTQILLAEAEELSAHDRSQVETIARAAQQSSALTQRLMALVRGKPEESDVLDPGETIRGLTGVIRTLLGSPVELDLDIRDDAWAVRMKSSHFEQILMNLLVNARDAIREAGRVHVQLANDTLSAETVQQWIGSPAVGPYVVLSVSDTGAGMDRETRLRIFEPFFTTKGERGTGLGLATVYGLATGAGGGIWVYSRAGHGTTFKVALPATDPAEAKAETTPLPTGTERVLLVEDETATRAFLSSGLRALGYAVHAAADPAEALARVGRGVADIDVLVSDVFMPGMSGPAMVERLLAEGDARFRVVFMSGATHTAVGYGERLSAGAVFVEKPIDVSGLARAIRRAVAADR